MSKSTVPKLPKELPDYREFEVYKQDCEFYRHQDGLMWSRFRTAVIVEAVLLFSRFSTYAENALQRHVPVLGGPLLLLNMVVAAALLVLVLFSISLKDLEDSRRHLKRIREFEHNNALTDHAPFTPARSTLLFAGIIVVNIVNILVINSMWLAELCSHALKDGEMCSCCGTGSFDSTCIIAVLEASFISNIGNIPTDHSILHR